MARYRITEPAYINLRMLQEGDEIDLADDFVPGPHMQPRDEPARRAARAAGQRMAKFDPIDTLTKA